MDQPTNRRDRRYGLRFPQPEPRTDIDLASPRDREQVTVS